MNDKIKEKLAIFRLLLSLVTIAWFGVISWGWNAFNKGFVENNSFYFALCVLVFLVFVIIVLFVIIFKLIRNL